MKGRIAAIVLFAGAMAWALSVGAAHAASDTESCKSTTLDQTNMNADGTECQTMVNGLGPNKATAKASGLSTATARAVNGAIVSANAQQQSAAVCDVAAGLGSATSSGLGAIADVDIAPAGGGKAKATGPDSMAVSEISSVNPVPAGGSVNSTASGGATAVADVDSMNGGIAAANAKTKSSAVATVESSGGGKATATSSGTSAQAVSTVETDCKSTSTAKGANSVAVAACQNASSVVTAEATNGSTAIGSDTSPPFCLPMPGGKAKVRSPMGNCPP
jgi:hypothetical protein